MHACTCSWLECMYMYMYKHTCTSQFVFCKVQVFQKVSLIKCKICEIHSAQELGVCVWETCGM